MSDKEDILQAFRSALKAGCNGTPLTNTQVIPADVEGPRPTPPYLTVKVLTHDDPIGLDEVLRGVDTDPEETPTTWVQGQRSASVSVQGFGEETAAWLATFNLKRQLPTVRKIFDDARLSVVAMEPIGDLAAELDTNIEARHVREFIVDYAVKSDEEHLVELEHVELDLDLERYDGDPRKRTIDIDWDL